MIPMAQCTDCTFETNVWPCMRLHYKQKHPSVKRPDKLFTKEYRTAREPEV